ncbi:hypothetical protein AB0C02_04860 [Micromonospora sp. NPDC048999]|uniref:hypothetical protein n=1 Tax=Micromonospora sp. NPDC048999 TaxID=3155391 RepID=UPI0034033A7F
MVYRYESDEDAFLDYPRPGSDPSAPGAPVPPSAGPSPSRFPTPSLPPPVRPARPARPAAAVTPAPPRSLAAPAAPRTNAPAPPPATAPLPTQSAPPQAYAAPPPTYAAPPAYAAQPPMDTAPPPTQSAPPPVQSAPPQAYAPSPPTQSAPPQAHAAPPPMQSAPPQAYAAPPPMDAEPRPVHAAPRPVSAPPVSAPPVPVLSATDPLDLPQSRRVGRQRGGGRAWQVLIGGAAVVALLALCGLAAATLLQDQSKTPPSSQPSDQPVAEQSATADTRDLASRDTDQLALTVKEVFPGNRLVVGAGGAAYQVLKTQASANCTVAATGEVGDLLVRLGCNQVVRATLRSPDGDHLLTAGLLNLTDVADAQRARDRIRQMLDERQGRFQGLAAGSDTESVTRAAARVGWQVRGHYIAYCMVTRVDGERISSTDAKSRDILYDMIEVYLNRSVLDRRANGGVASQPTAGPTDGIASQGGPSGN